MPGMASMITSTPMLRCSSPAPGSPPAWNMRATKRRRRQPEGVREKACQRVWMGCFISWSAVCSRGDDDVDDFVRSLRDVFFFDSLQENSFQGRCANVAANFAGRPVRDDLH